MKGGLGNQIFCYAAARRLALVNNAELVIDDVTGFIRDLKFKRVYALEHFNIPARMATPAERLEPFERYRRGIAKYIARQRPFQIRRYIEQEMTEFDARLLELRFSGTVYIDGLWQSEGYFKDYESVIRRDLLITPPQDASNLAMKQRIASINAICIHVRWFHKVIGGAARAEHNLAGRYYARAVEKIVGMVASPHFIVFSDDPGAAIEMLALPASMSTGVFCNQGRQDQYADLWLMTHCRHFIIANSTFSWWGAWLAGSRQKIVIAPHINVTGIGAWGFDGLIPDSWIQIPAGQRF